MAGLFIKEMKLREARPWLRFIIGSGSIGP
jgi:hypothetical protein